MEIREPTPTFVPASASGNEGGDRQWGGPFTIIFGVHGLKGRDTTDSIIGTILDWFPQHSAECRSLDYSPSEIVGEETFELALEKAARDMLEHIIDSPENYPSRLFMFWAHDIGGTIVKLALAIASQEEKYRHIVDRTHLIMFFGTPHRGSREHSLSSVILEIIYTCSSILPGRWTPRMINVLANQHNDIGRRLSDISHRFGIVNYYQSNACASPDKVVVPEECSTMGLETEVSIGRDHAHEHLPTFLNKAEEMTAKNHIISTRIAFWDPFKKFMYLISACASQHAASGEDSDIPVFSSDVFKSWVSSGKLASRYAALKLKDTSNMTDVLRVAAATVQEHQKILWVKYPELCFPEAGELKIYASLILQVLAQQPQRFMTISQLVPTVMDSIRSSDQIWAERTLWRCLRTLIHTPTPIPAYGFINIGSSTGVGVLHMLDSALQATESNFRLVLALREDQYSHCEHLDPFVVDLESTWSPTAGRVREEPTTIQARLHDLMLQDPGLEHWALSGLIWVVYALRPMTLEELDLILSLGDDKLGTYPRGSCGRFTQLLSGIIEIKLGRIVLVGSYCEAQKIIPQLTKSLLACDTSPHVQIARACLAFLGKHVFKNEDTQVEEWNSIRVSIAYRSLTEYAAQYWLLHYRRAGVDDIESEEAYSNFVADERKLKGWVSVVDHFSQLMPSQMTRPLASPESIIETLGKYLNLKSFKSLEVLHNLATRPSQLDSSARLLIYAAENDDEELLHLLYKKNISIGQEALFTAAAASRGVLHDGLIKRISPILSKKYVLGRIQLTAQVMGNHETSDKILVELLNTVPDAVQLDWFENVLRIAVENQDNATITQLLERRDIVQKINNNRQLRWTALHIAAYVGNISIMSQLLDAGLQAILDFLSPNGHSPLMIASSRGFWGITQLLLSKGASVSFLGRSGKTALHFACQYGCFETAKALLSKESDTTTADSEGDYPLHLAIRNRNTRLAELLARFPSILEDDMDINRHVDVNEPPDETGHRSHSPGIEMISDDKIDSEDDQTPSPFDSVNKMGKTVLSEAAEQNLPSVVKYLLEKGANPDVLDHASQTAIHLAAKMGALEVIKIILTKSPDLNLRTRDSWCTPLHFCCYRGHLEAAEKLLESGAGIGSQDYWNRTPLSAACASGSLPLVQALFHKHNRTDWPESLANAATYGSYDVVKYLLDMGCPINAMGRNANALLNAARFAQPKIVQLLISRGADIEVADGNDQRAIHEAVDGGSVEVVELLSDRGAGLDVENRRGETPLIIAISEKHPKIVSLLLRKGASTEPSWLGRRARSLLEMSFRWSSEQVTKVLLDFYKRCERDPNFTPYNGLRTAIDRNDERFLDLVLDTWYSSDRLEDSSMADALYYAIRERKILKLRKLLKHPLGKLAINHEIEEGGTVLQAAAFESDLLVVRLLLGEGADVNIVSGRFGTALNAACAAGKSDIARSLIRRMSTQARDSNQGMYGTPIQSAIVGFQKERADATIKFLRFLKRKTTSPLVIGGIYSTPLHASLNLRLSVPGEVVSWLIEDAPSLLESTDSWGRLPLHLAVLKGNWNLVSEILNSVQESWVSQLSRKDTQGLSGLHYSVISRSPIPLTNILQFGWEEDSINEKDKDDWTPLHWACRQPSTDIVKQLIERGADAMARTKDGWTPRDIAILHGNWDAEYLQMLPLALDGKVGLPGGAGGKFDAECEVCGCTIFWRRYRRKGYSYDNLFDLCFKCFGHVESLHLGREEFREIFYY